MDNARILIVNTGKEYWLQKDGLKDQGPGEAELSNEDKETQKSLTHELA